MVHIFYKDKDSPWGTLGLQYILQWYHGRNTF